MSLYGALFSGVSGLQAQSSAMSAIADNVTNVNTVGYKSTKVNFKTLVTAQASLTTYSAGGVQSAPRAGIDIQGLLGATTSSTDVGISGNGFFIVNQAAQPESGDIFAYTRAGSFKVDKDGFLQNVSNFYMQGWPLQNWDNSNQAVQVTVGDDVFMKSYQNDAGDTVYINDNIIDGTNLRPLNLQTIGGTAIATTTLSMGSNLPSTADVGENRRTQMLFYDTLGGAHNINHVWTKRATNSWDLEAQPPEGAASLTHKDQGGAIHRAMGRLDFTAVPQSGESMTLNVNGAAYTVTFNAVDDTDATDNAVSVDLTGRSLSQVMDQLSTVMDNIFVDAFITNGPLTATPSSPGSWVERVAGENSILFRNAMDAAITVDSDGLTDGAGTIVNLQGAVTQGTTWSVAALATRYGDANYTSTAVNFIRFNGDGTPSEFFGYDEATFSDPRGTYEIDWVNGSLDMDGGSNSPPLSVDMGNYNVADGITQFGGPYQINFMSQNGAAFGNFAGVSIGQNGIVTALFDNGVTRPVFQIPLATFVNPNGMESLTGNAWIETDFSGQPTVREAGSAGAGTTNQSSLENSTVDLGQEFTDMITTQRAYSAATKIISTSDEMLEELIRVKR